MRGSIDDAVSPHPIGGLLPALYQDDELLQRFCDGLDRVIGPVITTIDSFDHYLDPRIAPPDFVEWLAGWLALPLDDNWPLERRRAIVGRAATLYRWFGTVRGLAEQIAISTGVVPEIVDSGGVAWSASPGTPLPGRPEPEVVVRLRVADPSTIDLAAVEEIVVSSKPAHVRHRIEVLTQ